MVKSFTNRCAALATVAGACGAVFAQDVWHATPPQYYSWERNPAADADRQDPADDYVHDARFMAMLRVELSDTTTAGWHYLTSMVDADVRSPQCR